MPPLDWQLLSALAIVAAAAWVVGRRIWRFVRPARPAGTSIGCGGCGRCETPHLGAEADGRTFVPLEALSRTDP